MYACAAPYVPMAMTPGPDCAKDAIVYSSHKFPGGPGASGVMIVRDTIVRRAAPSFPGGGTVGFVSPWEHVWAERLEAREEGGTPNVVGDLRAGLVMLVKEAIGCGAILQRDAELRQRALERWRDEPGVEVLGNARAEALPIFSFRVWNGAQPVHHQFFTRLLSDVFGIQARGGWR